MNRHAGLIILLASAVAFTGCATLDSTRAIATPWGAGAVHSFKPKPKALQANKRQVDALVTNLLESSPSENPALDVRVAAR